jgi:hypothetical protein
MRTTSLWHRMIGLALSEDVFEDRKSFVVFLKQKSTVELKGFKAIWHY